MIRWEQLSALKELAKDRQQNMPPIFACSGSLRESCRGKSHWKGQNGVGHILRRFSIGICMDTKGQ